MKRLLDSAGVILSLLLFCVAGSVLFRLPGVAALFGSVLLAFVVFYFVGNFLVTPLAEKAKARQAATRSPLPNTVRVLFRPHGAAHHLEPTKSMRLLDGFGILDRRDEPMVAFSKGMLQKVSISAALLTEPKLLVFDEPLSGLDVTTALIVKQLMREFAERGGAVLHCSHMLDVVENTAHRIAVLDRGELLAAGTAAELRSQAGAGADEHLDQVFRSLVRASDPAAAAKAILG